MAACLESTPPRTQGEAPRREPWHQRTRPGRNHPLPRFGRNVSEGSSFPWPSLSEGGGGGGVREGVRESVVDGFKGGCQGERVGGV